MLYLGGIAGPGTSMPITPYLAHQAFEPEIVETMSAAFVAACDALHLKVGDDPATRFVAEKVINLAQRGIRDPDALRTMTLKELSKSEPIPFTTHLARQNIRSSQSRFVTYSKAEFPA